MFQDAYKTDKSCILIDDFERIIEYNDIGPRFSNSIIQTLMTYLKIQPPEDKRMLLLISTSRVDILESLGMRDHFSAVIHTPTIIGIAQMRTCLAQIDPDLARTCASV